MHFLIIGVLACGQVNAEPKMGGTVGGDQRVTTRPVRPDQLLARTTRVDPRARRAKWDACIAKVGESCKPLLEAYGDAAVAALMTCSAEVGKKLAVFHGEGKLDDLPTPEYLLACIGKKENADEVVLWAMAHVDILKDQLAYAAFLSEPLDYVLEMRNLSKTAAEMRAKAEAWQRERQKIAESHSSSGTPFYVCVGAAGVVLLLFLRRR